MKVQIQVKGIKEALKSLKALEKDHSFLLEGDVFTKDNIETYINYKRENEVNPMSLRPHPHEFNLYYDA